ncbi:DUF2280 domain-containing protein [Erythrobacter dokdonensis]|uniref:DUF2280 domain-containing protein n=1 Tax=Erythrobacter dokdonensis DSW-74 TaxID=1300349 RepID=A0A1A7BGK1_9SPHN|nr:DUF2280 domain-containing protein [Erythrobacter dokdonensis]OBV10547.1 DUF2280 domain-containing protein [Erythrobacter dokdonensis DSW-74]
MKRLPEAIKKRIVEHLACFQTPADVVDLIAGEFGVTLTPRHVRAYDPASFQFAASPRWLEYHAAVRERYREEMGKVAIAHRTYRLDQLQRTIDAARDVLAEGGDGWLDACEQIRKAVETAAKEVGDVYVKFPNRTY